nr:MAG TPA: hypothetical protein [Caudoviricetes sp.]
MAYVNDFKRVVDNVAPQIEVLQKAIKLDPENTIVYQRAIDFCKTNQSVSQTILNAIELVEKDSKKTEDGQKKDSSETVEKQKSTKAKKVSKPAPTVEEPPKEENTSDDVFDMFGD